MALKIRLARGGAKKRPFYRIVVAEASAPRDGRFVERLGSYNPMLKAGHSERLVLDQTRAQYWMSKGAKPTLRVHKMMTALGLLAAPEIREQPKKSAPGKKRLEREAEAAGTPIEKPAEAAADAPEGEAPAEAAADAPTEAPAEEAPAEAVAEEAPAEEAPAEETPAEAPAEEAPTEEAPVEEAPAEEAAADAPAEAPVEEKPADESAVEEKPEEEKSADESASDENKTE